MRAFGGRLVFFLGLGLLAAALAFWLIVFF